MLQRKQAGNVTVTNIVSLALLNYGGTAHAQAGDLGTTAGCMFCCVTP
jgi:hypothetical protein